MYWYRVLAPRVGVVKVATVVAALAWVLALRVGVAMLVDVLTSAHGFSRF